MVYLTIDRIEDGNIAVLIDEKGEKTDIPLEKLSGETSPGSVYSWDGENYIYNGNETDERRRRIAEKRQRLLNKKGNLQKKG